MKATVAEHLPKIPGPPNEIWPDGVRSTVALEHGSMQLRLFAPGPRDRQQPHTRDEIYVVIEGSGTFLIEHPEGTERIAFGPHDVLFVGAGLSHCFVDTTADFKTWVVFYGPEGGEA